MVQATITSTSGTLHTFSLGRRGAQEERGRACVARTRDLHSKHCHCRKTVTFLFQFPNQLSAQQQPSFLSWKVSDSFFTGWDWTPEQTGSMLRNYMEKEGIESLPKMGTICRKFALPGLFLIPSSLFCLAPGLIVTTATVLKCRPYAPTEQACKEHSSQMTREVWQGSLFPRV